MSNNVNEFVKLLESNEDWGFDNYGSAFMERADRYAKAIIEDIYSASLVSVETWTLFSAMLPFGKSLDTLSDLALVLPDIIKKMVCLDQASTDETTLIARQIVLERLNILVRKELHNKMLTATRKSAIQKALRQLDGHY